MAKNKKGGKDQEKVEPVKPKDLDDSIVPLTDGEKRAVAKATRQKSGRKPDNARKR